MTEQTDAAEVEAPVFGLVECSDCAHPAMLHDGNDGCNGDHCDCRWTIWEVLDRWLADTLAAREAAARAEALREAADELRHQAVMRFETHGVEDARGAGLWDAGCHIDPEDGNAIARTDGAGS